MPGSGERFPGIGFPTAATDAWLKRSGTDVSTLLGAQLLQPNRIIFQHCFSIRPLASCVRSNGHNSHTDISLHTNRHELLLTCAYTLDYYKRPNQPLTWISHL